MSWRVTIDQRTPSGATSREKFTSPCIHLPDAVAEAIAAARLSLVEVGEFQITACLEDRAG